MRRNLRFSYVFRLFDAMILILLVNNFKNNSRVPQQCGFVIERTLHVDDILIFDVYYTGKQIITIFTVVVVVSCCRRCSCCYHSHYCDTYFEKQTKGVVHYYHWERGVGRDFVMLSHNRGGGS